MRVMLWVFVLVLALLTACAPQERPASTTPSEPSAPALVAALAVLDEWDLRREAALRQQDLGQLGRLYDVTCPARASDLLLLRDYIKRDVQVRSVRFQRLQARIVRETDLGFVIEIRERLRRAEVTIAGRARELPIGGVHRRRIWFERRPDGWVVVRVEGGRARYPAGGT